MDDTCLGSIVCSLKLRNVDNMAAHRSSGDEASISKALDVAFFLLFPPLCSSSFGAVKCTIQVRLNHITIMARFTVDHRTLGPGNTGISHHDIETAVKLLDDQVDGILNSLRILDVYLIGLAWISGELANGSLATATTVETLTLNSILALNLSRSFNRLLVRIIPYRNVRTSFSVALCNCETNTSASACDNCSPPFKTEKAHQALLSRGDGVVVDKVALGDWRFGHVWWWGDWG